MTKRFLLINPYYPISETPSPPLGLAFLAGALEAAGIDVELLDLVVFPYSTEMLEHVLNRFDPSFVGFTAVTMNVEHALTVARDVKALAPGILTVMGGPHVTFCAGDTLHHAFALGYHVIGVADCLACFSKHDRKHARQLKEAGLYLIENHYGLVAPSEQIIQIISRKE